MCGLTGIWRSPQRGGALETLLPRMTQALSHRGPDDQGLFIDAELGLGLGHRRLSIFDVSSLGRQPMVSASGRIRLVFNGEIYNFLELRAKLEQLGYPFRSRSDTEVLLAGIEHWGVEATLQKAIGMFALASFDAAAGRLTLARDRLGKKPLYYGACAGGLAFASELHAFRAAFGSELATDPRAWGAFARFGFVPEPLSIYRDVVKLLPGCAVTFGAGDLGAPLDVEPVPFWDLDRVVEDGLRARSVAPFVSDRDALDTLHETLADSVRLRAQSDVPIGAFLSGGIDSSLVVALLQAQSGHRERTFSIGFHDPAYDESGAAATVAKHLGTDHTEFIVDEPRLLGLVERITGIYDEPFADSSALPTLLVSELARKHVTVALTGDGGDELFAGYNRHVWAEKLRFPLPRFAAQLVTKVRAEHWSALVDRLNPALPQRLRLRQAGDKLHKLVRVAGQRSPEATHLALASHWLPSEGLVPSALPFETRAERGAILQPELAKSLHPIERALWFDTVQGLPGDMLVKVDRASMSVGLEARQPLLDQRVVELSWRLPMSMKLRDGVGKWALRELLARHLPRPLFERPKQGFAVPLGEWLRGPLRELGEDLLSERALKDAGVFDPTVVRREWDLHQSRRSNREHRLWIVIAGQAWLRRSAELAAT